MGIDGKSARLRRWIVPSLPNEKQTEAIDGSSEESEVDGARRLSEGEAAESAPAPFTTSKLQQDASRQARL